MIKYLLILLSVFMIGCGDSNEKPYVSYEITNLKSISNPKDVETCVSNIVKSATEKMTTSDYEDVDDTIDSATEFCTNLYTINHRALSIRYIDGMVVLNSIVKNMDELTPEEKKIFDDLMTGKKPSLKVYYITY